MKRLILSAAIFAAFSANATGGHHQPPVIEPPPVVEPPPVAPPVVVSQAPVSAEANAAAAATASATGAASAQQRQAQQQAQQQALRASQQANGNGAGAGAGAGTYAGSNAVTIQGDRTMVLSLPSVPATPPSFVASATMTMMWSPCGPLVRVVAEAVYGERVGLFGGVTQVYLGANEKTEPYMNHMGDIQAYTQIQGRWFGHAVLYEAAVPGVASGTNLTIGGAGAGGGGQAGGGTSGGMQRPVERVQYRLCDLGPVVTQPPVIIRPQVFVQPIQRKVIKPRPPCVMEDKLIRVCKRT